MVEYNTSSSRSHCQSCRPFRTYSPWDPEETQIWNWIIESQQTSSRPSSIDGQYWTYQNKPLTIPQGVNVGVSPNGRTNQLVKKHMVVLYVCITSGSECHVCYLVTEVEERDWLQLHIFLPISTLRAASLLIGTPKVPNASIPPMAASHPQTSQFATILFRIHRSNNGLIMQTMVSGLLMQFLLILSSSSQVFRVSERQRNNEWVLYLGWWERHGQGRERGRQFLIRRFGVDIRQSELFPQRGSGSLSPFNGCPNWVIRIVMTPVGMTWLDEKPSTFLRRILRLSVARIEKDFFTYLTSHKRLIQLFSSSY